MLNAIPFQRVLLSELDISSPVLQHGDICRISVIQDHPTFLIETPWFVNKYDIQVQKYSSFRLYLEPYSKVISEFKSFLDQLENYVKETIPQDIRLKSMMEHDDGSEATFLNVRVPSNQEMYQCFDVQTNTACELNGTGRGVYLKLVLDLSDVWLDKRKKLCGFNVRLFQMQVQKCPTKALMVISKSAPSQPTNPPPPPKTAVRFSPNLDDIIKQRGKLTKV
jgi:hypothetical protein